MIRIVLYVATTLLLAQWIPRAAAQIPRVASGSIVRIEDFSSEFVPARDIDVWLPRSYGEGHRHAVLYMHDGVALFDGSLNWNGQEWGVDEVAARLMEANLVRDFIVVAIPNAGSERHSEFLPQKPYEAVTPDQRSTFDTARRTDSSLVFSAPVRADAYLRFIVEELKPYIDETFDVLGAREDTFMMGSSMGGLISIYALSEYPDVFRGVACLSTHWPGIFALENNPFPDAMTGYLLNHLPRPGKHRIYFDRGTVGLDTLYGDIQTRIDTLMRDAGYTEDSWVTRTFDGADHNETSWQDRLDVPMRFLISR